MNKCFFVAVLISIFLLGTNSSVSLPWSTDMWDHPSIKPYEEAREYP